MERLSFAKGADRNTGRILDAAESAFAGARMKHLLTEKEHKAIESRWMAHWKDQRSRFPETSDWPHYWKANRASVLHVALMFRSMLTADGWKTYLSDYTRDAWSLPRRT